MLVAFRRWLGWAAQAGNRRSRFLRLPVWSSDQHHLGARQTCRFSGSTQTDKTSICIAPRFLSSLTVASTHRRGSKRPESGTSYRKPSAAPDSFAFAHGGRAGHPCPSAQGFSGCVVREPTASRHLGGSLACVLPCPPRSVSWRVCWSRGSFNAAF